MASVLGVIGGVVAIVAVVGGALILWLSRQRWS